MFKSLLKTIIIYKQTHSITCSFPEISKSAYHRHSRNLSFVFRPNFSHQRHLRYLTKTMTDKTEVVIGTHDGVFHCDEILACFMLQQLPEYQNVKIIRTRDLKKLEDCEIVVDVGSVFDVGFLLYGFTFDH